jgi:DNA modification methylase
VSKTNRVIRSNINDLNGSQWLFRSKSVINKNYGQGSFAHKIRRLNKACKPPELCRDIVEIFTRSNDLVLDPFAGTGGIVIGVQMANRRAMGLEINNSYVNAYKLACREINGLFGKLDDAVIENGSFFSMDGFNISDLHGDISKDCDNGVGFELFDVKHNSVDMLFTDPPYFDMDSRYKSKRWHSGIGSMERPMEKFGVIFSDIDHWRLFMSRFCQRAFDVVKKNKYMVSFMEDMYINGEYIFLTNIIVDEAKKAGWTPQGEFIWYNEARRPGFFGYPSTFITNRTHTSILFFRKV